jgi:hypothetical protein
MEETRLADKLKHSVFPVKALKQAFPGKSSRINAFTSALFFVFTRLLTWHAKAYLEYS